MFETNFFIATTIGVSRLDFSVTLTSLGTDASTRGGGNTPNGQGGYMHSAGVISTTTSATWYLTGLSAVASVSLNSISVSLTRIA